jgi:hypothetical protein
MRPTVGRIVHYQAFGTPGGEYLGVITAADFAGESADPAIEGNYRVGLCILNPTGQFFNVDVEYDADGKPGTWRWPPRE